MIRRPPTLDASTGGANLCAVRTPKAREIKREMLLNAAVDLLLSEGVAGCTTRAIAEQSGLPRGSIHYYFEDAEQLLELAWQRLMAGFYAELEKAAANAASPLEGLWAVAETYIRIGSRATGQQPLVAFEYLVVAKRCGRLGGPQAVFEAHRSLLLRLATQAGIKAPEVVAGSLHRSLVGALIHQEITASDSLALLDEIMSLSGIPPVIRSKASTARKAGARTSSTPMKDTGAKAK